MSSELKCLLYPDALYLALEYQKVVNRDQINMELKCYFSPNVYRAHQNVFEIQELLQMHCTWH